MPKFITLTQLEGAGACPRARKRFEAMFGPRVRVTEELAKVVASEFNWLWAADHLLSGKGQRIFEESAVPARGVFHRDLDGPWATYWVAMTDAAWRDYYAAREAALPAFNTALAVAFAKAYVADG